MSSNARAPDAGHDHGLDILVELSPVLDGGSLLAEATVTITGQAFIHGVRVVDSADGPAVSMPQVRNADGGRRDAFLPPGTRTRKAIDRAVLDEYRRTLEKAGNQGTLSASAP